MDNSRKKLVTYLRPRRRDVSLGIRLVLVLSVAPSCIAAWVISHPEAVVEGPAVPETFGQTWTDDVARGIDVWSTPPPAPDLPVLLMVHGYRQPRSDLRLLAEHMRSLGYGIVIMELPYLDGSEAYSGGGREAVAVANTVEWTADRFQRPVVLMGFSAGGFASALAVRSGAKVLALITDSAFVDAAESLKGAASDRTHLWPSAFFALRPAYYVASWQSKLRAVPASNRPSAIPALVIHGGADDFIPPSNAERMSRLFGAELWIVDGAQHGGAWYAGPSIYEGRVDSFIRSALQSQ